MMTRPTSSERLTLWKVLPRAHLTLLKFAMKLSNIGRIGSFLAQLASSDRVPAQTPAFAAVLGPDTVNMERSQHCKSYGGSWR